MQAPPLSIAAASGVSGLGYVAVRTILPYSWHFLLAWVFVAFMLLLYSHFRLLKGQRRRRKDNKAIRKKPD